MPKLWPIKNIFINLYFLRKSSNSAHCIFISPSGAQSNALLRQTWNSVHRDYLFDKRLPREMFVEQQYVLARAKLHFTPVVLTPRAHLQRVEGSKTLSPIPPLGRESNSLAESGVLLEVTEKLCCQACSAILRVQDLSCFSFSVLAENICWIYYFGKGDGSDCHTTEIKRTNLIFKHIASVVCQCFCGCIFITKMPYKWVS